MSRLTPAVAQAIEARTFVGTEHTKCAKKAETRRGSLRRVSVRAATVASSPPA